MITGPACLVCKQPVDAEFAKNSGKTIHALCELPIDQREDENQKLKDALIHIIGWADRNSERSKQVALGPSEIGDPCERRIGYSLAGIPEVNFRADPWAAIVGTAIHKWMEKAVDRYQAEVQNLGWHTEGTLQIDDYVQGHTDLHVNPDVVDYKTKSKDQMEKVRKEGPSQREIVQGHLYGYGHARAGRPVRDVVLVFIPRDGRLKDMYVWREPYNQDIATKALERMYSIANKVIVEEVLTKPENWKNIPALPSRTSCWYCPFWDERDAERTADHTGCPGDSPPKEERAKRSEERHLERLKNAK